MLNRLWLVVCVAWALFCISVGLADGGEEALKTSMWVGLAPFVIGLALVPVARFVMTGRWAR